ncbi:AMP-binding enzyme [Aspergillus avenaceus]|uniref:AMP-binding enzyme n=1 Tax=Aspergillus avenaceus TaxID=36643 RepID=A0A5N6TFQ3_ASPAV|nr:AMP-binding enzyme [Aspergillus avenaceus]
MATFPLPGVKHGRRIAVSVIEQRAQEPDSPWASVPIDNNDLSKGFKDLSYYQLNNAANHAARWLSQHLPATSEPFQCFAYAGPKDIRFPILEIAAAKLQKVIVVPSPLTTAEAQLHIFEKKKCTVYLRPACMADAVDAILRTAPHITAIEVPELDAFMQEAEAFPYVYEKSWDDGKDDPWIVFHTSGTTGHPKAITYTHSMLATIDTAASLPDLEYWHIHQYAQRRWYTAFPSLHCLGTIMNLIIPTYLHTIAIIGPPSLPTRETTTQILQSSNATGATLTPSGLNDLVTSPDSLQTLRNLTYIQNAGAPLPKATGDQLSPYTTLASCIGSTESGLYCTALRPDSTDWSYISFQSHAGAHLEPRPDNLHELVFIRDPACALQPIFSVYPNLTRFETNDLWTEHPTRKGLWKIVGRADDYVYLAHADGIHASSIEPDFEAHPAVKAALIGGHGRPAPVLLLELRPNQDESAIRAELAPYIETVNKRVSDCVALSNDRILFTKKDKPFIRTIKGSISRLVTLRSYEEEIDQLF